MALTWSHNEHIANVMACLDGSIAKRVRTVENSGTLVCLTKYEQTVHNNPGRNEEKNGCHSRVGSRLSVLVFERSLLQG